MYFWRIIVVDGFVNFEYLILRVPLADFRRNREVAKSNFKKGSVTSATQGYALDIQLTPFLVFVGFQLTK